MAGGFGGAVKLTGESEYKKALSQIQTSLKEVGTEMKLVSSQFDKNDKSISALTARQEVLSKKLAEQVEKVKVLKAQYQSMADQYAINLSKHNDLISEYNKEKAKLEEIVRELGTTSKEYQDQQKKVGDLAMEVDKSTKANEYNEKSMSKLRSEINLAEADVNNTAKEMDNLGKETEESGKQAEKATKDGWTPFKQMMVDIAEVGIKTALSALKKLSEAIISVGKQAYVNYGQYEQLVGGVETLFGTQGMSLKEYADYLGQTQHEVASQYYSLQRAQENVLKNAENAFKTAGISANDYMNQVTLFSASLLQSLGGDAEKASEIANMAIIDMSDNANKMGTDLTSIQNAYQGFAKQNYTMLDNLRLGYGGTKTEMQRLLKDAEALTGVHYDISNLSDVYEAIHVIQQSIGITGTTAKEAEGTITGSISQMKASWQNLITGFADENADLSTLINNFVDTVMAMLKNSLPRIKQIISGIGEGIGQLIMTIIPHLLEMIPPILVDAIPMFISTINMILQSVLEVMPQIVSVISEMMPQIITTLVTMIPQLVETGIKLFFGLIQGFSEAIPILLDMLPDMIDSIVDLLVDNLPTLITAVVELAVGIIEGLVRNLPTILKKLWDAIPQIVSAIGEGLSEAWQEIRYVFEPVIDFFVNLWENIKQIFANVANWFNGNIFIPVANFFRPIVEFFTNAWNVIKELGEGAWITIKTVWGFATNWFNEKIITPVKTFFSGMWEGISEKAKLAWEGIKKVFSPVIDWFKDQFSKAWTAVKNVFSTGGKIFDGIKEGIVSAFKTVVNAIIKGINKVISTPFNAINTMLDKIKNISILGISPFQNLIHRLSVPQIPLLAKGAVLDKGARLVQAGEDGAEAIVPLEKNTKWIERVAKSMRSSLYGIDGGGTSGGSQIGYTNYDLMVSAFKDALSEMKVVLDDEEVGTFIDKTVTNLIYA